MLINLKYGFIFIHIPKNSGSAMTEQLVSKYETDYKILEGVDLENGLDVMHLYGDVFDKYINMELMQKMFKFCIVRNPYNKLYSAWHFIKERHGYDNINDFVKNKLSKEFIFGREYIPGDARVHYRPQYTFIKKSDETKPYVNYILRYESLNSDIRMMNIVTGLDIPLYANSNTQKSYIDYFDKESIKKINELYKDDFEMFGYDML